LKRGPSENIVTKDLTRIALNLTTNFPTIETPSLRSVEIFQDLEPIKRALKVVMQHEDSLRLVAERLSAFEIARNNSLDALRVPDISALSAIMAGINERFYIPKIQEVTRLFDALSSSHYADVISRFGQRNTVVEQAMSAMHFPWLDKNEPLRSFAGFAEIQSMGNALKSFSAYGDQLTDAIRASLGDWRQPISWNPTIFFDPINRAEFYLERGFDPALTNFPVEAFEESIKIAGFRSEPPSIVEEYGEPFPPLSDDVEAEGFKRNRLAFEWITRLEMNLRKFIDQVMTDAFGMDWAKHRLPNGLYDNTNAR